MSPKSSHPAPARYTEVAGILNETVFCFFTGSIRQDTGDKIAFFDVSSRAKGMDPCSILFFILFRCLKGAKGISYGWFKVLVPATEGKIGGVKADRVIKQVYQPGDANISTRSSR